MESNQYSKDREAESKQNARSEAVPDSIAKIQSAGILRGQSRRTRRGKQTRNNEYYFSLIFRYFVRENLSKYTREVFNTQFRSVINREFCDTRRNFVNIVNIVNIVHIGATCKKDKIRIGIFELEFIPILIISNNFYNFSTTIFIFVAVFSISQWFQL